MPLAVTGEGGPPGAARGVRAVGTTRRLLLGFGLLVLGFAVTSVLALAGLARVQGALERTGQEEERVRTALALASAVRDQYAHQAHTIIIGDRSHLPLYRGAQARVRELTARLREGAPPEEVRFVDEIDRASDDLDAIFREHIVPAVVRGDRAYVQAEHARAQVVVSAIQDATDRIVGEVEARIAREREGALRTERRITRGLLALLVAAPVGAAIAALLLGRSIARPLGRLQEGAARIARGDLTTRVEVGSDDEFGTLAQGMNAMATSLAAHQARLVESEKLAGVGRLAAGVAHELNSPLGVILGYVKLLRRKADAALADDLAVVEEEALRCKEIVEGLLDLARPIEAGREPIDLRALAQAVEARLREARLLEDVEVRVEGEATADGHPGKLRQVLANVLRNAGEAAGAGGRVTVRLDADGGAARVVVEDSGPGLDPSAAGRLFEPFFTTKAHGTGLGLAVSRAIARAHGGELTAENAPAGGARVTLTVPRGEAATAPMG